MTDLVRNSNQRLSDEARLAGREINPLGTERERVDVLPSQNNRAVQARDEHLGLDVSDLGHALAQPEAVRDGGDGAKVGSGGVGKLLMPSRDLAIGAHAAAPAV